MLVCAADGGNRTHAAERQEAKRGVRRTPATGRQGLPAGPASRRTSVRLKADTTALRCLLHEIRQQQRPRMISTPSGCSDTRQPNRCVSRCQNPRQGAPIPAQYPTPIACHVRSNHRDNNT